MADTSKNGLLLGGVIHHVTAASQFTRVSKQVSACVRNIVKARLIPTIFHLFARNNCYNVKLKLKLTIEYSAVSIYIRDYRP